jgi:hypothetical protein
VRVIQRLEQMMHMLKIAIYDIEMVDVFPTKKERETYVPVGLSPGSKDNHVVHIVPFLKKHRACERSAESCYFGGVEESARLTRVVEKGETSMLCGS